MTDCTRVRETLPAYFVDGPEGADRKEIEAHVAECAGCGAALDRLKALSTILSVAPLSPEPSPDLERHVFTLVRHDDVARLAQAAPLLPEPPPSLEERSLAPVGSVSTSIERKRLWPRVSLALTPAFGLAAVLLTVLLITDDGPLSPTSPVDRPSGHFMQEIRLTGAGEADLSLTRFKQDNYRLTLTDTDQLPPLTEGHHYELWLEGDEGRVSAGNFQYVRRDDFAIDFNVGVDPSEYNTVEITEEPDDGNPDKTGDSVCNGWFDPEKMNDL